MQIPALLDARPRARIWRVLGGEEGSGEEGAGGKGLGKGGEGCGAGHETRSLASAAFAEAVSHYLK